MPKGGKGSTPQSSQFSPMPQYGGMGNYMGNMGNMGNMFGGGQMGMGRRGGFGNVGIPNFGTSPSGKAGGFNNFTPQRMMQEAVPMPSLQQQYAGLNQGVREFEPLGIRGYTPPVYTQASTFDPFNRQSYFQNPTPIQDYYTPPPQMPQIPTMPNIPNIPFGPWNEPDFYDGMNQWDDRFNQQDYSAPPPQMRPPPYRRRTDDLRLNDRRMPWGGGLNDRPQFGGGGQQPMQPPRRPYMGEIPPLKPTRFDRPSTAPMTGLASLPNYIEPVRGLTADTTMYQQQLPFISKVPETISRPEPAPIDPMPQPFGLGIEQQTIEDNPVLARRKRERSALRAKRGGRSEGGLVKFQAGGVVEGGMQLEQEVIAAVMGQHPNPDEVFKRYIDTYGEEGLMELLAIIEQMIPKDGRMVEGAGDGLNDAIPAMIDGQQPAALSKDEYIIPADVVSHAGNGSSEAGGQKFDQLVSKVRQNRTGMPVQPEAIELEEVAQGVIS